MSLIEAANEFFFSDDFMETFESFAKNPEKNGPFKGCTMEGEHPLQCMEIYREFQGMYEGKLESFLATKGVDAAAFAAACQEALSSGGFADQGFVEILLSMAEYKFFVKTMAESADGVA